MTFYLKQCPGCDVVRHSSTERLLFDGSLICSSCLVFGAKNPIENKISSKCECSRWHSSRHRAGDCGNCKAIKFSVLRELKGRA